MKRATAALLLTCLSLAALACGVYGPPVRTPRTAVPVAAPELAPEPATEPASEELRDPPEDLDQTPDVP